MPIPPPGADEDATPIYGIRKPKSTRLAKWIWQSIARVGDDVESALQTFGLPPVVSSNMRVAASAAARDASFGTPATAAARRALQDSGAQAVRTDKGWVEQYFAGPTDGGANPAGVRVAGWYPVAGKLPSAKLKYQTTVNIANTLWTNVTGFASAGGGWADSVTETAGTLVCAVAGRYKVEAAITTALNGTGGRIGCMTLNGTTSVVGEIAFLAFPASAIAEVGPPLAAVVDLAVGDVIRIFLYQSSGGTLALANGEGVSGNYLSATYLRPS